MTMIVGLLLAAGRSRRFGADKLLQPLPSGDLVITASARLLAAATDRCIVLIRPDQIAPRAALAGLEVEFVEVPDADSGMGVTLACGIRASPDAAGWVIALGDMPCLQMETLCSISKALRQGANIAAPFHAGRRGHPVGFAACWGTALSTLSGDAGARDMLRNQSDLVTPISVDDPGCLLDIDTPSDFLSLTRHWDDLPRV